MRLHKVAVTVTLTAAGALAVLPTQAGAYTVKQGDTLWAISRRAHADLRLLIRENDLRNPDLIYPGQQITIPDSTPPQAPPAPSGPVRAAAPDTATARALLRQAAAHHGVDPRLVLALSDWESGFNESKVSKDGAVGLMQILPATARWAGPSLLHRQVDLADARDNAELGAALLGYYLRTFKDEGLALAAYYQGAGATRKHGIYPSSKGYVKGILSLRQRM